MANKLTRLSLAKSCRHLFINDDGSLPDIYIENISAKDFHKIISWIDCLRTPDPFPVWNIETQQEEIFTKASKAALLFEQGKIETFRFPSDNIFMTNQVIPTLGFGIYSTNYLELDYRMGKDWTDVTIIAFLDFLTEIRKISPQAVIQRCDQGCYPNYDADFFNTLMKFQEI